MKYILFITCLFFLSVSCKDSLFQPVHNTEYILEVDTRPLILQLADTNKQQPAFQAAIHLADSLKEVYPDKRYSELLYSVIPDSVTPLLKQIFINRRNAAGLSASASGQEVIQFIEEQITSHILKMVIALKQRAGLMEKANADVGMRPQSDRILIRLYTAQPDSSAEYLTQTGDIRFCNVAAWNRIPLNFTEADQYLARSMPEKTDSRSGLLVEEKGKPEIIKSPLTARMLNNGGYGPSYKTEDTALIAHLLSRPDIRGMFPAAIRFVWLRPDKEHGVCELMILEEVESDFLLTPEIIEEASYTADESGNYTVAFSMNKEGTKRWSRMTQLAANASPRKRIAILLDGVVIQAFVVNGEIPNGKSSMTGFSSVEEAKALSYLLKSGVYPAAVRLVQQKSI